MSDPELVGRSSSHFTRTARLFAIELGVAHSFRPIFDITSLATSDYAGNPALKMPVWVDEQGSLFGTENVCREVVRRSGKSRLVVMRGELPQRLVANCEELALHAMYNDVSLVMAMLAGDIRLAPPKLSQSMQNSLGYLDQNIEALVALLPQERILSFVEATIFAVVTHLPFRQVMDVSAYSKLCAFCKTFGERSGAKATEYRFDTR